MTKPQLIRIVDRVVRFVWIIALAVAAAIAHSNFVLGVSLFATLIVLFLLIGVAISINERVKRRIGKET